jgi:hypothetical protein
MSYDLMVFDPSKAPRNRSDFMAWYTKQTEWSESHAYDDPAVSSAALRNWFMEMIQIFPALNGPHATDDDNPKATDYSVGRSVIYAAFAWSEAEAAHPAMFGTAQNHGVGFFDVSGDEGVWLPNDSGQLERAPW